MLIGQLGGETGEDQHGTALDYLDLRHFKVAETPAWPAQRGLGLPVDEVVGSCVPDHPALVSGSMASAGGQEHVPAVAVGVSKHPWVAPCFVELQRVRELFIPAGIDFQDGRAGMLAPVVKISRCGQADALPGGALPGADAGVEHEPVAVPAAYHRAGPGRDVIKCRAVRRRDRIGDHGPVRKIR